MRPEIYWVKELDLSRFALMPRPRAGEWLSEEISGWREQGVGVVVSLLESHDVRELDLSPEPEFCKAHEIKFVSFPMKDRGAPESVREVERLVQVVVGYLRQGFGVAVHCRAGIGRAGVIAACVALEFGIPLTEVFSVLGRARGVPIPDTDSQAEWVRRYANRVRN